MRSPIAIATAGALGLAVILRTAIYYAGVDATALGITGMMGVALALGIAELVWVSGRTRRLHTELAALPPSPTHAHVTGASALLRALLTARLDRTPLPVPGPVFAPFLVGLLVMLGLLGTFLGLFETLRGAGQALTASADVEALRSGLEAPISGLMQAFGTSAAGVASSAMLGISSVFVRRDNDRLGVALHAAASGPLARHAPAQRQLVALERLAEQGAAWPEAARTLAQAVERLETLTTRWDEAHQQAAQAWRDAHAEAARAQGEALELAATRITERVGQGVTQVAERAGRAVQPELERAARALTGAIGSHLKDVRSALADEARAGETRAKDLHDALGAAASRIAGDLVQATSAVRERLDQGTQAETARQARAEALFARLEQSAESIATAAGEQVGALQQFVEATDGRLRASEARGQERLEQLITHLESLAQSQVERLAAFEQRLLEQHGAAAAHLTERFTSHTQGIERDLERAADLVQQAATLLQGSGSELGAVAESFAAAVEKQREGARAWLESLGDIERAVVSSGEAAAADVLGQHLLRTHEVFDRQLQLQQALIDQLRDTRRDSLVTTRADAAG